MNILYKDKTWLNVNKDNRHVETVVTVLWDNDDNPIGDFDFGNDEDNAEYMSRFKSGELLCICIMVRCSAEGETGTDSLGMCHVKANDLENEVRRIIAEHDMKNNACKELRENILSKAKLLSKYI